MTGASLGCVKQVWAGSACYLYINPSNFILYLADWVSPAAVTSFLIIINRIVSLPGGD
jgi:hypothetical protein